MNHIYRVIWNTQNACWQAVSELARGTTKSTTTSKAGRMAISLSGLFAVNILAASVAIAGPSGGVVSAGTATINSAGATTTINQSSAKAAIDWSSFSTSATETVNFVQPDVNAITLNRVTGTSASTLNGKLNANGQVFIINPNGVLFGSTSQVNTGGLIASTLNLSNTDFLNNTFKFANSSNNKTVENRGKITVPMGGTVALIAPSVKHTGTITTPEGSTLLAAGSDVTLTLNNRSLVSYTINQGKAQALINAGGLIKADGGKVILTAQGIDALSSAVVNTTGIIEAKTVNSKRGVIELGSDLLSGTLNVSGTLDASAPVSGNGGLIKTTANTVQVSNGATITTQRTNLSALPPTTSGWELTSNSIDIDFFGGTVNSTTLSNALDKGNVTLKAVGTGTDQGNININDTTQWSGNTALTLTASKDINFNSEMTLSGDKAKLAMNYDAANGHDYNLTEGAKINITGALPTLLVNGTAYTVINELGEEGDASTTTLQGMQNNLSGNYALGSDIDASDTVNWNDGKGFEAIGEYGSITSITADPASPSGLNISTTILDNPFTGQFHGLGHAISNITINGPSYPQIDFANPVGTYYFNSTGLFSATTNLIRNIGIESGAVSGAGNVGGLIGTQVTGLVSGSYSNAHASGISNVGGLVGTSGSQDENANITTGLIKNSYAQGAITVTSIGIAGASGSNAGGLVGLSYSPIINSYATGNINLASEVSGYSVGGLVGELNNADIINSYATGNISGNIDLAGGLVGAFRYSRGDYQIKDSYATGSLNVHYNAGGLVGYMGQTPSYNDPQLNANASATIDHSYATGNVQTSGASINFNATGGLVGSARTNTHIKDSYATGNIIGTIDTGGLVGGNYDNGEITNSHATGSVTGTDQVGGLVGSAYSDNTIDRSFATGTVTGNNRVGGLIGVNSSHVINSHALGDVLGTDYVGGLIGAASGRGDAEGKTYGNIENTYAEGGVTGNNYVGGLIGSFGLAKLSNSHALGEVNGNTNVGGLVGYLGGGFLTVNSGYPVNNSFYYGWLGEVQNSYASGAVNGSNNIGGLVGNNIGTVQNSYAVGRVSGDMNVGGLIGITNAQSALISHTYSSGHVTGNTNSGGLIGQVIYPGTYYEGRGIYNNYWNTETSGQFTSAGGIGKTTAELQQISTFNGWDIADISDPASNSIWFIDEDNDTPRLRHNP